MHEHEAKKSGLSAETQPHSGGHNTELTCNVAQTAPSVINTTYHSLKSAHKLTTLRAPRRLRRRSRRRRPHSQPVRARPGGQDDAQSVASRPSLVSYDVNGCLGPVMGRRRPRWRGYVLRGLDNNAGSRPGSWLSEWRINVVGRLPWLRGGQQVDDRAYSGGNTLGWSAWPAK